MPYAMRKLPNSDKYQVKNEATGHIFAHSTTKPKAMKQLHLLHGMDHGVKRRSKL